MLAHAFLVVAALADRTRHPVPAGLISLTCNEIQHLFAALIAQPVIDMDHRLRWSDWRASTSSSRPQLPLPAASRLATM